MYELEQVPYDCSSCKAAIQMSANWQLKACGNQHMPHFWVSCTPSPKKQHLRVRVNNTMKRDYIYHWLCFNRILENPTWCNWKQLLASNHNFKAHSLFFRNRFHKWFRPFQEVLFLRLYCFSNRLRKADAATYWTRKIAKRSIYEYFWTCAHIFCNRNQFSVISYTRLLTIRGFSFFDSEYFSASVISRFYKTKDQKPLTTKNYPT